MFKRFLIIASSLLLITAVAVGCGEKGSSDRPSGELKKVVFMLDWVPNTNHTGIYVAKEKGYFTEEGLDVEIVQPSQGGTTELVATDKAQFGVSQQEEITMARSSGVPIVSIASVIQHNTSCFASKKELNILSPKDFEGKRYGGWGAASEEATLKSLMLKEKASPETLEIINIGTTDFFTAINRDIDFAWIFYGWTGVEAEMRGIPLNTIMVKDLDSALDYYTPLIFTSEKTIAGNPDLVKHFLAAASRGYEFSAENPDQAADILIKQVPELDPNLVKRSQKWLSPRYIDDASRWGEQKEEVWQKYADWMESHGLLPQKIEIKAAFTNGYLPK
ncbi:MAG: ABC transporter substrate-binding protein [Peptococcaceae bacterium]|nr:ABC transporter substrate-binding protein [Peptococcaceae bacterium]